jgi:hypothetical protein
MASPIQREGLLQSRLQNRGQMQSGIGRMTGNDKQVNSSLFSDPQLGQSQGDLAVDMRYRGGPTQEQKDALIANRRKLGLPDDFDPFNNPDHRNIPNPAHGGKSFNDQRRQRSMVQQQPITGGGFPITPALPQGGGGNNFGFTRGDGMASLAMVPWENPDTGETYMAPDGGYSPPEGSSWVRSSMGNFGGLMNFGQTGQDVPQLRYDETPLQELITVANYDYIPSEPPTGIANDPVLTNGNNTGGYFDTSGGANTYDSNPYNPTTLPNGLDYSGNNSGYLGSALGGLFSGDWMGALRGAGDYYLGQKGAENAYGAGMAGMEMAQELGRQAAEGSQFKPYTVTSNLAQVETDPRGGYNVNLSPAQRAMQEQALGQAGQFFGQVGDYDPSLAAQRGAMGGLFGQSLGEYGQPTGLEGLTQAGISGAQEQFGRAGQPYDLNQLRGQFAGQVGSYLGQQPNEAIGGLGDQALQLGSQGLGDVSAPTDIEALRSQYAGLAGQAGQGLLMSPEERQADIYQSIRATQTPEEERQRLALEERMLAQGRTGVSSAAYGGASPELLAMETARQEAMARAGLSARQQAMTEQQQGVSTAQALTGLTTGLAGTSSDIESAAQSRATQLSNLGLSAEQIESQLQSEGLSRATTAGTTAGNLAGMASDLETAGIGRGTTLANLGLTGTQASDTMGRQQLEDLLNLQRSDMSSAQIQQALQQGRLGLGSGMLQAGYMPQQQALELLRQSQVPAQFASQGNLQGANLYSQLGAAGIESYMGGAKMANDIELAQRQGLMQNLLGSQPTTEELLISQLFGVDLDQGGGGLLESILGGLGGLFGGGGSSDDDEERGSYNPYGGY